MAELAFSAELFEGRSQVEHRVLEQDCDTPWRLATFWHESMVNVGCEPPMGPGAQVGKARELLAVLSPEECKRRVEGIRDMAHRIRGWVSLNYLVKKLGGKSEGREV